MAVKKLNRRHLHFIEEYVVSKNATASAEKAGYTGPNIQSTACKLLKDPLIKAAVDKKFQSILKSYDLSAEQIIGNLGKIAIGEDKIAKPSDIIRANELLAKVKGLLSDKQDTTINVFGDLDNKSPLMDELSDGPTKVTKLA